MKKPKYVSRRGLKTFEKWVPTKRAIKLQRGFITQADVWLNFLDAAIGLAELAARNQITIKHECSTNIKRMEKLRQVHFAKKTAKGK